MGIGASIVRISASSDISRSEMWHFPFGNVAFPVRKCRISGLEMSEMSS
jgi:hypothetical protein